MPRLIDADKLMLSLNDNYLANSPTGNETLAVQDYRESMCEGLEIAMATVEGAPTVGGWISVKDDLPKEFGEQCIVYNGSSVQYGDYYSNGEWYTPDCYESEEIIGVTHWMPLPEPPKEESDD